MTYIIQAFLFIMDWLTFWLNEARFAAKQTNVSIVDVYQEN